MQLNEPITSTKTNYGLTSLLAGILQVIFGFSLSFVPLAIMILALFAGIKSIKTEKDVPVRKKMAVTGLVLVLIMSLLYFAFGMSGLIGIIFEL
jgi:hypothetical protein